MPTGQAPAQHSGADWVALGSVAPAATAATPKLEGLRMTASDIGDFLGPGGEACPQESSGLRRSARAPKPLKPIGEEPSGDDHSSLSEPEEAETPPSKRSKVCVLQQLLGFKHFTYKHAVYHLSMHPPPSPLPSPSNVRVTTAAGMEAT